MYKCGWENHWVDIYSDTMKDFISAVLVPLVIFDKGIIDLIADFGCGQRPKSDIINRILKAKYRILVDIGLPQEKDGEIAGNSLYVKADMEELLKETKCYEQKRRIAKFIGLGDISLERIDEKLEEKIDIAIFSDIFNYVDYKLILDKIGKYIAKDGRVVILNKPGRGYKEFFSNKGVKSNHDLIDCIKLKGYYDIERCLDARRSRPSYGPWREVEWSDHEDDNTWMLLIVKKKSKKFDLFT
ncbi:MAG: hypothetical protein L6N96_03280 [Candidatus Methylarchaceae archaeon HK02M2]|nr:hypothetical protein [Candidatus Methylarchaceae archaeon HK02M2]